MPVEPIEDLALWKENETAPYSNVWDAFLADQCVQGPYLDPHSSRRLCVAQVLLHFGHLPGCEWRGHPARGWVVDARPKCTTRLQEAGRSMRTGKPMSAVSNLPAAVS